MVTVKPYSIGKRYRSIDILQPQSRRSTLAGDLIMAAPATLKVFGFEYNHWRMTAVVDRWNNPKASAIKMRRDHGSPPRGEADIWDLGVDLIIRDHVSYAPQLPGHVSSPEQIILVPVTPDALDLAMAREIAASASAATPPWWFLVLASDASRAAAVAELAALGPVVPVSFGFRISVPEATLFDVSGQAMAEAASLWEWLGTVIDVNGSTR